MSVVDPYGVNRTASVSDFPMKVPQASHLKFPFFVIIKLSEQGHAPNSLPSVVRG